MNNKLFFSFILFVFSPLIASEKAKNILDEKIYVNACVRYISSREGQTDYCIIIGKHDRLISDDLQKKGVTFKISRFNIETIIGKKDGSFQMKGLSSMLVGLPTKDFEVFLEIENQNNIFQQRIKHCYDLYKKDATHQDSFFVHLEKIKHPDIISLQFTGKQVEQIISMKKTFSWTPIFVGLSFAGFAVALIYYFDLYSKSMTLLGRG